MCSLSDQIDTLEKGQLEWLHKANGGSFHVSWQDVCRPLTHGGLGWAWRERDSPCAYGGSGSVALTSSEHGAGGLDLQFTAEEQACSPPPPTRWLGTGETANSVSGPHEPCGGYESLSVRFFNRSPEIMPLLFGTNSKISNENLRPHS